jgi:hypothetical protein
MTINPQALKALIDAELSLLKDIRVVAHIRALLVEPTPVMRDWDYGREGEQFPCWSVLEHSASNTGIAYCENGFGPRSPWGLVSLESHQLARAIGMDCSWYTTFLQAYFESKAATELAIWRVFRTDATGLRQPITNEGEWEKTWSQVMTLRKSDPANRYNCSTSILYERE